MAYYLVKQMILEFWNYTEIRERVNLPSKAYFSGPLIS